MLPMPGKDRSLYMVKYAWWRESMYGKDLLEFYCSGSRGQGCSRWPSRKGSWV